MAICTTLRFVVRIIEHRNVTERSQRRRKSAKKERRNGNESNCKLLS